MSLLQYAAGFTGGACAVVVLLSTPHAAVPSPADPAAMAFFGAAVAFTAFSAIMLEDMDS